MQGIRILQKAFGCYDCIYADSTEIGKQACCTFDGELKFDYGGKCKTRVHGGNSGASRAVEKDKKVAARKRHGKPLYYHKTDGGAEYLCSDNVNGTDEGSFGSKYIVRIDGDIIKDAELFIRD
ncbi:MAG: hypothetical protein ABIJ16_09425 [Bacteroidota bacterium]